MKTREEVIAAVTALRISKPHLYFEDVLAILEPQMNGVSARDLVSGVREGLKRTDSEALIDRARDVVLQCLGLEEFPSVRKRGQGQLAHYELVFRGAVIDLGTATEMLMPPKVEAAFLAASDFAPNIPSRKQWRSCATAIAQAAEQISTGTEAEETVEWIGLFAAGKGNTALSTKSAEWHHLENFGVLEIDGTLHLNSTRMAKDLLIIHGVKVTRDELARRLSRLGFERKKLAFRVDESVKTMHTWRAPFDFDPDSMYTGEVGEPLADDPDRFRVDRPAKTH